MDLKKVVVLSGFAVVMLAAAQISLAQEPEAPPADSVTMVSDQATVLQKEGDIQWAWGEVVSLDSSAQTITLKYLDYETDQEKELVVAVDEKTVFENIKDFNQLKEKDTLSIDYLIGADNRNIAQNISFEKPEDLSSAAAPVLENNQPPAPSSSTEPSVDKAAVQPAATPEASLPVESAPAPVESAPAPVESAPAPVESAPAAQGQAQ